MPFKCFLYTVPRSLPSGWTQPTNWIGYSTYPADRTPQVHILATTKFGNFIRFTTGTYPSLAHNDITVFN
jgi:hypothetical protein